MIWTNYPQTQLLTPYSTCKPNSLASIVAIVREAESLHKHVHAFGSKWSFSDCAFTNDYVIDTRDLNRELPTIQLALKPDQISSSDLYYHVEAGINIRTLYENLDSHHLAPQTMGASSGQTLAGAISTGTHGGDKFIPPPADSVVAIHIVGYGGTQFWIEPSSGITDPASLKAHVIPDIDPKNIIYDDTVFNACLVSLGCMGVIYAIVLRVRKAYDLVESTVETTWQDFKKNASIYLNDPANRFLQVLINPYPDNNKNNLCLVTTRTEASITKPGSRPQGDTIGALIDMIGSFDLVDEIRAMLKAIAVAKDSSLSEAQKLAAIVQWVLTHAPEHRTQMVEHYWNIVRAYRPPSTFRGSSQSVMDGDYEKPAASSEPSNSIEIFFPSTQSNGNLGFADFVDYALGYIDNAKQTFFAGYFALLFMGQTRAYLGMQQWKQTCSVEISVVQGVQNLPDLLNVLLVDGTRRGGLPHWGQQIDRALTQHGSIYPQYAKWRQAYAKLSSNFTSRTFENSLSLRWNLTTPNDAKFVSQTVSDVMEPAQSQSVTVTMQNTGTVTWTRSASYRLGLAIGDKAIWRINRVELPSDVLPGEQVTFRFNIIAQNIPPDPKHQGNGSGIRRWFQWRMLQELVEWFGVSTPPVMISID